MDVDILIHVYVDSGHLSLKTTQTHVGNEHGNVNNSVNQTYIFLGCI